LSPELGGDFSKLEAYELDQLKQRAEIHQGPLDETFESLPSQYLDLTAKVVGKSFGAEVRSDVHVASDHVQKFVSASQSRSILGTGYGENLKKAETRIQIEKSADPGQDSLKITVSAEFTKPWFIPESVLLSEARARGPKEYARGALKIANEIARNY